MKKSNYENIASLYDQMRPAYPSQMFQDIKSIVGIRPEQTLLEIGAGTGKATLEMAKFASVDALEIEASMADFLEARTENEGHVNVIQGDFETWQSPNTYPMIYSAQAFHWLDKSIKYKKSSDLLRPSGYLCLIWYLEVLTDEVLFDRVQEVFTRYQTGFSSTKPSMVNQGFSREEAQLTDNSYFLLEATYDYTSQSRLLTCEEFLDRYQSTSAYEKLSAADKLMVQNDLKELLAEKTIEMYTHYRMFVNKKKLGGL